jgi:hypothetical protein
MINDKLSRQLYETMYPVQVGKNDYIPFGMDAAWVKFVDESINNMISIKGKGVPSVPDYIDQELRFKYDGAFYDSVLRFKTESAVTMFLLRFS